MRPPKHSSIWPWERRGRPSTTWPTIRLPPWSTKINRPNCWCSRALATRPELAAYAKQLQASERLVSSAKAAYGPQLGASTGLTEAGPTLDNLRWNWNAQVTLSWPLFQGMLVPAQVREAQANLVGSRRSATTVEQQLRLEVEQARLAVRAAKASIVAVDEALTQRTPTPTPGRRALLDRRWGAFSSSLTPNWQRRTPLPSASPPTTTWGRHAPS